MKHLTVRSILKYRGGPCVRLEMRVGTGPEAFLLGEESLSLMNRIFPINTFPVAAWVAIACLSLILLPPVFAADGIHETYFRAKVEPILVRRCLECHGADRKGGLDLRTKAAAFQGGESGAAIEATKPDESLLFQYVDSEEMPPKKPLSAAEIAVLKRWISDGAFYPEKPLDLFAATSDHRAGHDWWSLQPVKTVVPPAVRNSATVRTEIDRFVVARLQQNGLGFSSPADRRTLIRRVSLDLTGLPPTYEQQQEFINDPRDDAYERLVDRLLASPHYGERWGRHWLDVVRFAESNGFERDRIRENFWPYRDYVIRSFNADKPYDQFVREQLAGDALKAENADELIATGFLVAGPKNDVATVSELERLQTRQDELDEFVTATSTTFLGLTSGCARCHDHKFDPIDMRDYYALTAVFSGLDRGVNSVASAKDKAARVAVVAPIQKQIGATKADIGLLLQQARKRLLASSPKHKPNSLRPAVSATSNEDEFEATQARFVRFTVTVTLGNSQPCLDELEIYGENAKRNLALSKTGAKATASSLLPGYPIHQVHHLNDGQHGNSHSWISNESGKGWAQIELPAVAKVQRVVWGRDRNGKYNDRLPVGYRIEVSLDGDKWLKVTDSGNRIAPGEKTHMTSGELIAALTASEKKQHASLIQSQSQLAARLKAIPPLPVSYSARDGQPQPAYVLTRGNVRDRGEQVKPAAFHTIKALDPLLVGVQGDTGPNRRLRLAEWIVDAKNPLTARVFVNRIWHYHFGQGIVNTPNDFGFNGDRPSHPKLLDWLAADFMEHGWKIKRLHRMIVLSAAYRQQSAFNPKAASQDGANRLLWRMSPRRLDAESLRDAVLQVSGKLDLTMEGPSFRLFRYRDGNVPDYILLDEPGPETWRRSVYRFNIRTFQSPLMSAFDCPNASVQTPKRNFSTTALQALSLMNNRFTFQQSQYFAARVTAEAGEDPSKQANVAYRLALLREPTKSQRRQAVSFIENHGLFSLCRVLLNTNEFLYAF
ncbi:MAG: DUF1553 domain-containing protein [Planctomycetaceae bacterium]|nr:DUF1553 domain-containing protein [Planctomycetaceae bacterium]MBT6483708.1 DUF1553 domain-containing protein [Planctomycetaceae bacterium]MBT6497186.1 DUF1553 domain-containing protein [Planctomycetaceae bacterium]